MNSTKTTLTDYLFEGKPQRADAGTQQVQGAPAKIKICGDCGGKVVFVQSATSGKWYLADVFTYKTGGYYYAKNNPHFKSCGEKQATITVAELTDELKTVRAEMMAVTLGILTEQKDTASVADVQAMIDEATAGHDAKIEALNTQIAELRAAGARN